MTHPDPDALDRAAAELEALAAEALRCAGRAREVAPHVDRMADRTVAAISGSATGKDRQMVAHLTAADGLGKNAAAGFAQANKMAAALAAQARRQARQARVDAEANRRQGTRR
ncbi:hypothetical protein [Gordonia sp. NB41Y]|uniref:hypothetical protein n=1 Tax=Gordonia sp. NB41Y TaxID=875808 RepID=UPI0006B17597|nr:hypothetical protein [Gordonia sp. NB41Y]KOY49673.1 hypothetical protein ISGA_08655 [Gordonia sp. NB41Y]WLP92146.1 hypothetical protein Q9K23_07925 [Gordonia sp. NB41Y]